jgi:hypothetical protein
MPLKFQKKLNAKEFSFIIFTYSLNEVKTQEERKTIKLS